MSPRRDRDWIAVAVLIGMIVAVLLGTFVWLAWRVSP
jgi:hypothetical protein